METKKLSESQKCCLMYPEQSRLSYDFFVRIGDANRASTVNALVKKGFLEHAGGDRFWLTDSGIKAHEELSAI